MTFALLAGCKEQEFVTVPVHHTDTLWRFQSLRDSIICHDSIRIREKGDTVWIERWRTKYVEKLRFDTTYISKTDSVPVPYPVEKLVEKQLSWWQHTQMYAGDVLLLLIVGCAVYGIIRIRNKFMS